jgi:dTMP kinase
MKQGRLITFEGIEGCGKSTQMQRLSGWLAERKIPHACTREPGGTDVGARIRQILLSDRTGSLEAMAEVTLYFADRFQHVSSVIRPRLDAGELVLCDRFHDSTVAYQGYARGVSLEWIERVWSGSGLAVRPNLTFLFDVPPEIGIARSLGKLQAQKLDESRFEHESIAFHTRVRNGFLELAAFDPERFEVIDGKTSVETIHNKVIEIFDRFIKDGN